MAALDLQGSGLDLDRLGLPVANSENKLLEAQVQKKEKEINSLEQHIDEHKDRIQTISDHLKNVRQELQQTQALCEARKRDVESEDHMKQIAEREEGRLKDEMRRLQLEREDFKEKMNIYENTIFKTNQRADQLKSQMNWDQQALEAWLEESARKDEDAMTLAKYARADESKIKALTLKLEHLMESSTKKKKVLNGEVTETLTAQIELDKTAEEFRSAHEEREVVIQQWEQIIDQMKRRDQEMDKCAGDLARLKAEVKASENHIREKQEFFDNERKNNEEKEKKLNDAERLSAKMRLGYQDAEASRIQFRDELETLKYSVDRAASDLDSTRAQSKELTREIKDKRKKLETIQRQRELLQHELKKNTQKTLSAEERAQQMDQMLSEEEATVKQLEKELSVMRERQFKHAQELFDLKRQETTMQAEIQGGRASVRNLRSKIHKLDEEALKQQEILYTQDFQLQQLQHKLNRMEGERTDDEKMTLNTRIAELEKEWEHQQGEEHILRSQLKRLQDDLRRVNRHLEKEQKEKDNLEEKIDEINLHIDSTQRELRKVVVGKQSLMVDENITKLEVKRLRDGLFSHADEVDSLEKRKLQLDTAMSERNREISVHKDMLKAQIKGCESERQTVNSELHERISKIDKLRKRYEILAVSMAPPEDGEEHSQAYYVIKAAQEREELQRQGDDLDSKIRKAEREIRAMENTLALMNSKNEGYRKSLTKVDQSSEEIGQLETLEGQWRAALDKHKHRKRHVKQLEEDLKAMGRTLSSLKSDEAMLTANLEEKQNTLTQLNKDLEELKAKKDRVTKQTSKLVKELKAKQKVSGHSSAAVERDIELRELRDFGNSVIQQLGSKAAKQPEIMSTLQLLFSQAGLPPPPSPTASRTSSALSSARSSISQLSALSSARSSSSRVSATPSTPKAITVGAVDLSMSTSTTPRQGMSPRSSTSSLGGGDRNNRVASKSGGAASSRQSSRPSSTASSRHSSRASSQSGRQQQQQSGRKKSDLDLTIGPS